MPRAEALGGVGGYFPDLKGLFFDPWRATNSRWSLSQQGMQVHSASVPMSNSVIWNPSPQLSQVLASRRVVFSFLLIVPFLPVVVAVLSMPISYPLHPLTVKQKGGLFCPPRTASKRRIRVYLATMQSSTRGSFSGTVHSATSMRLHSAETSMIVMCF